MNRNHHHGGSDTLALSCRMVRMRAPVGEIEKWRRLSANCRRGTLRGVLRSRQKHIINTAEILLSALNTIKTSAFQKFAPRLSWAYGLGIGLLAVTTVLGCDRQPVSRHSGGAGCDSSFAVQMACKSVAGKINKVVKMPHHSRHTSASSD